MLEPNNKPDNEMNPAEEAAEGRYHFAVDMEATIISLQTVNEAQAKELANLRAKEEHRMQELAKERSKNFDERLSEFVRAEIKRAIEDDLIVDSQSVDEMIREEIACEAMGRDEVEAIANDCLSYNPEGWQDECDVESIIETYEFDFVDRDEVEDMILDNMGTKTDVSDLEARIEELEAKLMDVAAILE